MTDTVSLLIPIVGALWAFFTGIAIVVGRRRRADPTYRPAIGLLIGLLVTLLLAFIGMVCLLLVLKGVPLERFVKVLLLFDTGLDTMLLRFGLISIYGITVFALINIFRRRRS